MCVCVCERDCDVSWIFILVFFFLSLDKKDWLNFGGIHEKVSNSYVNSVNIPPKCNFFFTTAIVGKD